MVLQPRSAPCPAKWDCSTEPQRRDWSHGVLGGSFRRSDPRVLRSGHSDGPSRAQARRQGIARHLPAGERPEGRGSMSKSGTKAGRGRVLALVTSVALLVATLTATAASAAAPAFTAAGSARQVYVTGLAPSTQVALVNSAGAV